MGQEVANCATNINCCTSKQPEKQLVFDQMAPMEQHDTDPSLGHLQSMGNRNTDMSKASIKQVSFAKGLRFAEHQNKWQYLTHPQKWSYIRKEAWTRKPVECEVPPLAPETAKPWDDPSHLMKALHCSIWKLQAQWRQIDLEE